MEEKMLKMKVGSKLMTCRGFVVRTSTLQWRVVRKHGLLSRPRWVATLMLVEGRFVNI